MSRNDEIDELLSTVRSFVAHKDNQATLAANSADRLVLTAAQRLPDEEVATPDSELDTAPPAFEAPKQQAAGSVAIPQQGRQFAPPQPVEKDPGLEGTLCALEAAVSTMPEADWTPAHATPAPRPEPVAPVLQFVHQDAPEEADEGGDHFEDAIAAPEVSQEAQDSALSDDEQHFDIADPEDDVPTAEMLDLTAVEELITARLGELINSDALQALVVRTVHEELSGEMGERITRNVRKLVRREINRVMTSRELGGD